MKKKNILKTASILALAGSITLFAACSKGQTVNTELNKNSASKTSAQSSEIKSISLDEAIEIALKNAEESRENVYFSETKLDSNDAVPHYDIDFTVNGKGIEYEYEIAVSDGKIIKSESEAHNISSHTTVAASDRSEASKTTTAKQNSGYISVDDAKAAALKAAGINEADAVFEKAAFDGNDLIAHYDIEFDSNGYEYDYEINAVNGEILEQSQEKENDAKILAQTSESSYISEADAKAKALEHAGISEADVKRIKTELDVDDIIPHYEIEFHAGNFEYDYEINAKTGNIIAAEKDIED